MVCRVQSPLDKRFQEISKRLLDVGASDSSPHTQEYFQGDPSRFHMYSMENGYILSDVVKYILSCSSLRIFSTRM